MVLPTPPFWFAQAIVWPTQGPARNALTVVNSTIAGPFAPRLGRVRSDAMALIARSSRSSSGALSAARLVFHVKRRGRRGRLGAARVRHVARIRRVHRSASARLRVRRESAVSRETPPYRRQPSTVVRRGLGIARPVAPFRSSVGYCRERRRQFDRLECRVRRARDLWPFAEDRSLNDPAARCGRRDGGGPVRIDRRAVSPDRWTRSLTSCSSLGSSCTIAVGLEAGLVWAFVGGLGT